MIAFVSVGAYAVYELREGTFSRAWDGSGHQAIARMFSESVFPDTYGWSYAYFGGMPFPNFYPPVFYWTVGLLAQVFAFETAFKLVIITPVVLLPVVVWFFIRSLTGGNRLAVWTGAIGSLFLLLDGRFIFALPAGLDFFSTVQIGLYTHPLGFVFLLLWYVSFQRIGESGWRFSVSTLLLALTVLSNFFAGTTAALLGTVIIVEDLVRWLIAARQNGKNPNEGSSNASIHRRRFLIRTLSAILALCLTLFWLVPMISEYSYFTTRPYVVETGKLLSSAWWVWFALAVFGFYVWYRNPTNAFVSFAISCLLLSIIAVFATFIAPDWFPLQSPRYLAMLNFFLVVPVGLALNKCFRWFARLLGEIKSESESLSLKRVKYSAGVGVVLLAILFLSSPGTRTSAGFAFIRQGEKPEIEQILAFAADNKDGRYLVEVIHPTKNAAYTDAAFDARAINAYLGSNGNETLSAVFHEASPHSLFALPVTNSLSDFPDSFGISSVLADDLDFHDQPIEKHLVRARFLGVKYFVIRTPQMKEKLSKSAEIGRKHDFGWWSVHELKGDSEANPTARVLENRPALVISDLTLKARYDDDLSYIRFVEEQFADGWFDVLLARSSETKIDRLESWEDFGAVIVNDYDYDDETLAFAKLKKIADTRLLILIQSEDRLFKEIGQRRDEFRNLDIVERPGRAESPRMLNSNHPTKHYEKSPIRALWKKLRQSLEARKFPVPSDPHRISAQKSRNRIDIDVECEKNVPVVISNTFHPGWNRTDGRMVYATTPFYQLSFANRPFELVYGRSSRDRVALWISLIALIGSVSLPFIMHRPET